MTANEAAAASTDGARRDERIAQARRWYRQRISAMVLAVCVAAHLALVVYATRGGLSGAEVLARTRGSWGFGAFYAVFVVACAVHVPPGLANIAVEWLRWPETRARWLGRVAGIAILALGLHAVYAVVAA